MADNEPTTSLLNLSIADTNYMPTLHSQSQYKMETNIQGYNSEFGHITRSSKIRLFFNIPSLNSASEIYAYFIIR